MQDIRTLLTDGKVLFHGYLWADDEVRCAVSVHMLITASFRHVCGNSIAEGWRGVSGSSESALEIIMRETNVHYIGSIYQKTKHKKA